MGPKTYKADNESPRTSPERNLWSMVIVSAIEDASKPNPIRTIDQKAQRESRHWLFHHNSTEIRSLSWVCQMLGIDIEGVRKLARAVMAGEETCLIDSRSQRHYQSAIIKRNGKDG